MTLTAVVTPSAAAEKKQSKIVVGKSIDGANIGATPAQVTRELGAPILKRPPVHGETVWDYPSPVSMVVVFANGHLNGMFTTNKKLETGRHIHVGSSPEAVEKAYPDAKCTPGAGPGGPDSLACILQSGHGSNTVDTAFEFTTPAVGVEEVDIDLSRQAK